jgi:arsenite/tail-anchored protein-transporting ATPase
MTVDQFLTQSRVLIVAGKGGVGKSTTSVALAQLAHQHGISVAHIELDGKTIPTGLDPGVTQFSLTPGEALREYLATHGLARVGQRLENSGILDLVASTAPGIDDLLLLGKIKQLEQSRAHDLIVVDGPAAGQAIGLLRAAATMQSTVSSGPISQQAQEVRDMVSDPARCRVLLITTPAHTPVIELLETRQQLIDEVGVALGPIIVNGVDSVNSADHAPVPVLPLDAPADVTAAWQYRMSRQHAHREAIDQLRNNVDQQLLLLRRYATGIDSSADIVRHMTEDLAQAVEMLT